MDAIFPAGTRSLNVRPARRALAGALYVLLVLAPSTTGAVGQTERTFELPPPGVEREQSLDRGQTDEWRVDLASSEWLTVAIEPLSVGELDQWPRVVAVAPDGRTVFESAEPSIVLGIDSDGRLVASFIADPSGSYRLDVAAAASGTVPPRYRLTVLERRAAVDQDRQRLDAHRLLREGGKLFRQGTRESLRTSLEKFEEARTILARIDDGEGEAATLDTIAAVAYNLSDAARGSAASMRALDIWTRLGREREEGIALSDLGLLAYLAYDHPAARAFYDRALAKHRAAGDTLGEARTLTRIGWIRYAAAELQGVLDINREAIALYRNVDDPVGESTALNDFGRAYLDLGEVAQALDSFEQALALRPPDRFARGAANVLNRMGMVYLSVGEWQRALDAFQQGLALARRAHDSRIEITMLTNLGSAYVTMGDTAEGIRHLDPALTLARSIDFRSAETYALLWLGVGASLNGEWSRGREYLEQALAIATANKDVRSQATTLRQLGVVHMELGAPEQALDAVNRSIEVSPRVSGLIYTGALSLANVYAALGDTAKAQAQYEEAIARFREVRARNAESLALTRYARFQAQRGLHDDARRLLEQAVAIHESLRGLLVDPDLRMSYTSASRGPYELYTDVLMELDRATPGTGFAAQAFHTAERARARGLLEMLATSGIDVHEGVDQALVDRERTLRWNLNSKAAIQTSLLVGKRDDRRLAVLDKEIAELSRAWRETTTTIRQQSPAYASLTEPEPLTVDAIHGLLDANTVLLEFAPGTTRSWMFAVTDTSFESFALPPGRAIDDAARAVHRLLTARQPVSGETTAHRQARIARADADLTARSRALSDLVLGPLASKLATEWRGRRLAIVASGALEYVPFAALPDPATRGRAAPLVAAHEIVTLPSASSLALLRRDDGPRTAPKKLIAVFADPVFAADDPRVKTTPRDARRVPPSGEAATRSLATRAIEAFVSGESRGSLARLPFSRAEAIAVAAQVPAASRLEATDFDATLALATSGRLNDYRIIHFATHGLINTTRPELSGLALSLVDADGRSRDGFLRLNTIYNLRLSADLVVLSACQSALGKEIAGEGLVGLTRGFMYAGARRVIASLWQVSDSATAELMKKFYTGLLQRHLSAAAALRGAQLEMSRDPRWVSPYFWAGFVLQGDWQ